MKFKTLRSSARFTETERSRANFRISNFKIPMPPRLRPDPSRGLTPSALNPFPFLMTHPPLADLPHPWHLCPCITSSVPPQKRDRRQPEEGLTVVWRRPNVSSDVRPDHFGPNRNPPHGASALRSSARFTETERSRAPGRDDCLRPAKPRRSRLSRPVERPRA